MFKKEIKIIIFSLFIIMFNSCQKTDLVKKEIDHFYKNNNKEIFYVQNIIQFHLQELIDFEREIVLPLICSSSWEIDSIIYFSQDKRRLYTHYLKRQIDWKDAKVDVSNELIGAYINDQWYFLEGSVTYFPRDDYKSDGNTPFTFEELSYLANRRLFPNIVSQKDGKYVVANDFFANTLKELDSSNPEGDSLFLARVSAYSTKSVPKEKLEKIRQEQRASRPRVIEPPSTWQRWFGKKKLFDTKEWKNRRSE